MIEGGEHAERSCACRRGVVFVCGFQRGCARCRAETGRHPARSITATVPASASIHEEATYSVNVPFMPIFNNLVIYKQNVAQNSIELIVPDLAESWAWSDDNKTLDLQASAGRQMA